MATTDAMPTGAGASSEGARSPGPLFTVLTTGALLAFAAFFIGAQMGGTRAGIVEVLAILLATTVFARFAYTGQLPRPFNASLGVLLLTLLAVLTALSVGWSILPNESMLAALRLISYTSVLAMAALLAQLHQERAREVLLGIGLGALAIAGYALFSHCFPGLFGESDNFARLRMPFGYWNAVGSVAGIGLLTALWAGTRRRGPAWLEVISLPAGGAFIVALMLSQSRGALLAVLVAIAAWLVIVPQRLRSAGWLAVVGACSMFVVLWAYSRPALANDGWPMDQRQSTGLALLGAVLVLFAVLAGIGLQLRRRRLARPLGAQHRHAIGRVLIVLLAISPLVLILGVGVGSDKGFTTISDEVSALFSTQSSAPGNTPGRLTQTSSLRARYWSDAYKIFKEHPLHGTGGDTFLVARMPFRHDQLTATHAHGMVPQVASDLGVLGLLVLLGLATVWIVAALKLAGAGARAPARWLENADETRIASVTIMLIAFFFGLHSAVDWIWFVPSVAYFGLLAGGWVLGSPAAHSLRAPSASAAPATRAMRIARAMAIAIVGIIVAWSAYQPVRAERKVDAGLDQVHAHPAKALKLGKDALALDETSDDAYILVAIAYANGGQRQAAERTLLDLSTRQPGNPTAWLRLASFRLNQLDDPDGAIDALRPLLFISPNNTPGLALLAAAKQTKTDDLIERAAARRRKALEKMLEDAARLRQQATGRVAPQFK